MSTLEIALLPHKKYRDTVALIDAEDLPLVAGYRWKLLVQPETFYAHVAYERPDGTPGYVLMHRLIADAQPGDYVHHVNGYGLDNRRENLEVMGPKEAMRRFGENYARDTVPAWEEEVVS